MANRTSAKSGTVASKRADYYKQQYEKAKEALKQLKDPNRTTTTSLSSYSRETIRGYLQSPASNETGLRNASRYLYYRSQIYYRIVQFYATMWDLRCRKVIPQYNLIKGGNDSKILKSFYNTLNQLDIYNIQGNWYPVAEKCLVEDVCYALFLRDDTGAFFYILDADECKIDSKYFTGDFGFAINMSKWRSTTRQQLIEWIGEPLVSMYQEYMDTGKNYIHVPDEYAACFKFRSSEHNIVAPPFAELFQELSGLNDLADIQAIADEASIYKLLVYPIKTLAGAKQSDDFSVSVDLAMDYFNKLINEALPDYVTAAPILGDGVDVVSFTDSAADKDVDRYEQSQSTILSTSGAGAVLNTSNITSTAAFKAWLQSETEFGISSLLPQIEGFTNRMLSYDVTNPCKVEYFEVSVYTKDDLRDQLLTSCEYSFSNRLAYNTFNQISEKETIAMIHLEQDILKLPDIMKFPLTSSHVQSGTSEDVGRPLTDDDELTPSGERTRNS